MHQSIIVMTGGTSGLGAVAARKLVETKDVKLILGYRKQQIPGATHFPLDLKSLGNVQSFASQVIQEIDSKKIQVLICNAGMNYPSVDTRTIDGFETTFAVNHLAHFLLIRLLMPHLDENAKIILTTSGTHNPAENTVAAPPVHANVEWLAYPEKDTTLDEKVIVNAQRAYSSSKLCNLLTARYINSSHSSTMSGLQGIAYDPGPVPGTGLMQNGNLVMRALWHILTLPFLRKRLLPKSSSITQAGGALADLALGKIRLPDEASYAALRQGKMTFPQPSELAQDDEVMINVWCKSEEILQWQQFEKIVRDKTPTIRSIFQS